MVCELQSFTSTDDQAIIRQVDQFSSEDLDVFQAYCPVDLRHYNTLQLEWLRTEVYFLGCRLCHQPTCDDILTNPDRPRNSRRFRAYYCMRYADRVYKV
ncbi:MAG: hypothetical protein SFY80_04240 [Verrucomicrobiota bacterium]|nr:hypothetical protein [Verrucomicrobiota bacterium]